ncbi:AAA family ATPase [Patescibacteria group bacterium]|nr:AAA family ATPase [Patescibacteria group bacterium]
MQIETYFFYILLFAIATFLLWKYGKDIFPRQSSDRSKRVLSLYTADLTEKAKQGKIDPVVGRDKEVENLVRILSRRNKNNPLLLGSAGVGKTAIVEGLALRIAGGDVPSVLSDKKILSLNIADMIGGTKYRGEFEERVKKLVEEIIAERRRIILFIDEIHSLIQTKGTEGSLNISDILKPALARGELQTIGATTTKEYEQYFKTDEALSRRFQIIQVSEPTAKQALEILKGIKGEYEAYHKVVFSEKALSSAVNLSVKYIKGRLLPDKAIDLMDETGAFVNLYSYDLPNHALKLIRTAAKDIHAQIKNAPEKLKGLLRELESLKKEEAKTKDTESKDSVQQRIMELTKEISDWEKKDALSKQKNNPPEVTETDIKKVLAQWLNIDVKKIK